MDFFFPRQDMERVLEDDNLLEEILLRLSADIVHGCMPVCKRWYNLVSSLPFRRRHGTCHLHLQPSSSKILVLEQGKTSVTTLLDVHNGVTVFKTTRIESDKLLSSIQPFYEKLRQKVDESKDIVEFRICDAYNGLFLFSLKIRDRRNLFSSVEEVHYLVCNPLTKEYQELVLSSKYTHPYTEVAFAPAKPYGHYKVIVASVNEAHHRDCVEYIVQIYSSETQTWKDSGHITDDSLYDFKYVVWDNCLLLVPKEGDWRAPVCVLDSESLHVSYSSSLLPNFDEKHWDCWINYLGESGGFLYVIVIDKLCHSDETNHYTLWEMEGVEGSWREKFQFKTEKDSTILYVHKEGEHVWLVLMLETGTVYYCLDGTTERLEEAGDVGLSDWGWNIRPYTPTLFPLGG